MIPKKSDSVEKALSQEAMTILSNIQSLTQELMTAEGQSASSPAEKGASDLGNPPIEKPEQISTKAKEEEGSPEDDQEDTAENKGKEKVEKEITKTPSDSSTASDPAVACLLETLSEVDEENVDEVKKAIRTLKSMTRVRKSSSSDSVMLALKELTGVMKSVISNQKDLESAVSGIMEGFGITKQIEDAIKVEKSANPGTPIMHSDNAKLVSFLHEIKKSIENGTETKAGENLNNSQKVLKNLETAVSTFIPMKR